MKTREQRIRERAAELYREQGPDPIGSRGWPRWARATHEVDAEIRKEQQQKERTDADA